MTRYFLFMTFLLFNFIAQSQIVTDFDQMKRKESRNFLLSQQTSDLASKYAKKHKRTRNVANGFLIGSGVIVLSGVVYHFTHPYEKGTVGELGHAIGLVGFMWGTGLTLATSGILHFISASQLRKAKSIYLTSQQTGNSTTLGLGISIRF